MTNKNLTVKKRLQRIQEIVELQNSIDDLERKTSKLAVRLAFESDLLSIDISEDFWTTFDIDCKATVLLSSKEVCLELEQWSARSRKTLNYCGWTLHIYFSRLSKRVDWIAIENWFKDTVNLYLKDLK